MVSRLTVRNRISSRSGAATTATSRARRPSIRGRRSARPTAGRV